MDNLPIPQSRIEELMNAFISRDSSQISTPQSRIEEFWYHLIEGTNALPIPQSRIELLLKKIIENDTKQIPLAKSRAEEFLVSILTGDINKLPIPQSRSEYYLDYIARNNLVLDDIEYLKYNGTNITATNTVQKPFKSAILKGNAIKNYKNNLFDNILENGVIDVLTGEPNNLNLKSYRSVNFIPINGNFKIAKYGICGDLHVCFYDSNKSFISAQTYVLKKVLEGNATVTPPTNSSFIKFYNPYDDNEPTGEFRFGVMAENEIIELEIQSVKLPVLKTSNINQWDGKKISDLETDYIEIYNCQFSTNAYDGRVTEYDENFNVVTNKYLVGLSNEMVTTKSNNCKYIRIESNLFKVTDPFYVEGGLVVSSFVTIPRGMKYEPHKSNILSTSEEVVLRGIGDVQDTLDCLTGEVTERIEEITFDGSESWNKFPIDSMINHSQFYFRIEGKLHNSQVLCDSFISMSRQTSDNGGECVSGDGGNGKNIWINILNSRLTSLDVDGFKQWLSQNPITVQYQLEAPSIKTVDLKVVDQDGNPVNQLSAFDSTTHIISDSESDNSLIAIAEVEVPTKLIEALNAVKSLSSDVEMLINEVDNAQKLQDENSTMVMSAMTELYEMVLVMGGGS